MDKQLTLIEQPKRWQLDERTIEIGRRGLTRARDALHRAAAERAGAEAEAA